jgi:hypothetical protein
LDPEIVAENEPRPIPHLIDSIDAPPVPEPENAPTIPLPEAA